MTTTSLTDVLALVAAGAGSTAEVARRSGSTLDVAEAALATLAAAGRIRRVLVFAGACAADGCGSCVSARGCASAGAGSLVGSGLTAWRVVEPPSGPSGAGEHPSLVVEQPLLGR